MSPRLPRAKAAALAAIQRVRRIVAEEAVADTRRREAEAEATEAEARTAEVHAEGAWRDLLGRPGFAPEWSRALAEDVIARQAGVDHAAAAARAAAADHEAARETWRAADARVQAADTVVRRTRRAEERKREERRLDALADRVTARWGRR